MKNMLIRRLCLTARKSRLLATVVIVTSIFTLFLGQQMPQHNALHKQLLQPQRRSLHLETVEKDQKVEVPPIFKTQEEELMAKIKAIASDSLMKDVIPAREVDNESKPPQYKIQKENVANTNQTKDKVKGNRAVQPPKIIHLIPPPEKSSNYSNYPPEKHPDRFKFIHEKRRVSIDGPKVNYIPNNVTWRHSLEHVTICNDTDPFIMAIVISAVPKLKLRDYIRRTWANPRLYPYTKIRAVFIVGATNDKALQDAVDREHAQYSDIIQYNYIDSYMNLTHKSLAWLKWVGMYCPQAQFVAKIDDDVMVNPFHLRTFFEEKLKVPPVPRGQPSEPVGTEEDNIATTYIYGRYDGEPHPLRYTKWAVSMEEYPEKRYPPFVHGPAYVVGRAAAKLMLKYAPYVPFLKLEDVYTTGLLAHAAQVKHVEIFGTINTFKASSKLYNGTQALLEETNQQTRERAWEGISLYAPVNIKELGIPWTS